MSILRYQTLHGSARSVEKKQKTAIMQMDIGTYIGELLYRHDAVALPGLGTFVNTYRPAVVDQVKGELHPPGRGATFNPNLVADDGLLLKHLQNSHQLDFNAAKTEIQQYVEEVKTALGRQEIIDFPEVGRLYQDYEKNLQFLPDNTNFSLEAYGLPMVEAYPVARPRATAASASAASVSPSTRPATTNYVLIGAIAAGVAVILVAGYFLLFNEAPQDKSALLPVPASRVNVSPSDQKGSDTDSTVKEEGAQPQPPAAAEEESTADEADWGDEVPTPSPDQKRLIIIIGAFGNQKNVSRLVDEIYDAGYEPYTEKSGSLTRVGVQKAYRRAEEVDRALQDVRNRFNTDAKLIEK